MLYALSGAPRSAFENYPMPRATAVFEPTFVGSGVVRSDDILLDPRYGKNSPNHGMPKGHLPVRSYLAVPVMSRSGEVLGGLFFGHAKPKIFREEHETALLGLAGHAATAIDNARLFSAAKREIEERRRAEDALQRLNATLEQRVLEEVEERTKAEEHLRQAQKMEAVGQLTGGIAHDFNNMLAVVMSGLNLAQRKLAKGDADVGRFIEGAVDGAQRAAELTKRLLAFSRQQPLAPKRINLNRLVGDMSELLTRTLGETIQVETVLGAGLWQVEVDPAQLESAVLNLSVNARDAMADGGKLTIETGTRMSTCATPGICHSRRPVRAGLRHRHRDGDDAGRHRKSIRPVLYDQGRRQRHRTWAQPGLRLRPAIWRARQALLRGAVGTTVKIYLPRSYWERNRRGRGVRRLQSMAGQTTEVVMVVEDEDRVRAMAVEALRELGYSVIEMRGPKEALGAIQDGRFQTCCSQT